MTIAQAFIKRLQDATGKEPLPQKFEGDSSCRSFGDFLKIYAEYYRALSTPQQKEEISEMFWEQVKSIGGTPIIEDHLDEASQCDVYFLIPKKKVTSGKDLYLQGDFHGYDSTDGRQKVTELADTEIMLHRNTMPRDAVLTYRYIQLKPSLGGKTPTEHHGSVKVEELPATFFPPEGSETPRVIAPQTENASDKFWDENSQLVDDYSTHREPVIGFSGAEKIFRVSSDPAQAKLPSKETNWSSLLSPSSPDSQDSHFKYHSTLYSTLDGELHFADPLYRQPNAGPRELFSRDKDLPYADCTRAVHVFMPTSGKVDNVVIINDGMPYLGSDIMGTFEKMVEKDELSENTAFICITPLPALLQTIPPDDPKASMPGNGERIVDYEHRIEEYVTFIKESLLPTLEKEGLDLPDNPKNRVMIGASISGTASLYIGSKHPELISGAIAQSPSPSNRSILRDLVATYDPAAPRAEIYLSCGEFEKPGCADNTNLPYAIELSEKLDIPLQRSAHGHQFVPWIHELEQSLPATLTRIERTSLVASSGDSALTALKPSTDTLLQAQERMQSFKAKIPHATPSPAVDIAEDEKLEDDNSITP